jgi:tetratricopeptide (TPR) repeat protein
MLHTPTIEGLATTAHNLFLNIAVENGLLGLIVFTYCIFLLLSRIPNIYKKGSVEDKSIAAIFIGLLVLFQFNFHYRIYFLFVMLFICGAFIYEENERIIDKKHITILVSGIIAFISAVILIAKILFLNGNSELALQFYPIYTEAYKSEIKKSYDRKDIRQLKIYLISYYNLFSKDPQQLQVIGDAFLNLHDNSNALDKYKEALQLFPKETGLIINVYGVYQKIDQEKEGQYI